MVELWKTVLFSGGGKSQQVAGRISRGLTIEGDRHTNIKGETYVNLVKYSQYQF